MHYKIDKEKVLEASSLTSSLSVNVPLAFLLEIPLGITEAVKKKVYQP